MIKYESHKGVKLKVKLIAVCSGKGGTGKSCVGAYTAAALSALKKKVLLVDAAVGLGSLDLIFGLQDTAVFNLHDVLSGACEAQKAVLPVPRHPNLFLLPAGLGTAETKDKISFPDLIKSLKSDYAFIIIDGLPEELDLKSVNTFLLVTTPDTLSVRAASQKCRELYDRGADNVRLVINNVPARVLPMKSFADFDEIIDQVGAQLIAVIPTSGRLQYASNNGVPISRESLTVEVFGRLAQRVRGKQEPLLIR